jgi:hypothetical protein
MDPKLSNNRFAMSAAILSRRALLARSGWVLLAGAIPSLIDRGVKLRAAESMVSPAMAKLCAYMSQARERALPDEVLEKTKHHVLDTFAA